MSKSSNNETPDRAMVVAAILLALPPLLALAAAAFPQHVPIPFVEVTEPEAMRPVFLTLGVGLLVVNAVFLFFVRRILHRDDR